MIYQVSTKVVIIIGLFLLTCDLKPLLLTTFVDHGDHQKAKSVTRVHMNQFEDIESYAGYLTVNHTLNSNMFFWFFRTENKTAPLLIWLQGGPGFSSLFGLFVENGPFEVTKNKKLKRRKYSWTKEFSLIYFDFPIGVGFSYTENEAGYCKSNNQCIDDLHNALLQFYKIFPELKSNDLYITGQSYGCKFTTGLAYKIHKHKNQSVKLKGLAIGGAFCDPPKHIDHGENLYQFGLVDKKQKLYFNEQRNEIRKLVKDKNYVDAYWKWNSLINGVLNETQDSTYFYRSTGLQQTLSMAWSHEPAELYLFETWLNEPQNKQLIHVGNIAYKAFNPMVKFHLIPDFMKSMNHILPTLFENYKVLFFSGNFDIVVNSPSVDKMIESVEWSGKEKYMNSDRKVWKHDDQVIGYVKQSGNLSRVILRNAGHVAPLDQSKYCLNMLKAFINNHSF